MKKIAVIDDEIDIAEIVSFYLKKAGFETEIFPDGESFFKALNKKQFDGAVLDLMLPGVDGIALIKIIRVNKRINNLPILVLTAKSSESDIISALEAGADNYITKPFNGRILAARVKALLRKNSTSNRVSFGDLSIDEEQFKVFCKDKEILLTKTEFNIIKLLVSHPGKVFSRTELLDNIWSDVNEEPFSRSIDVHIRNIRKKLGECSKYLKTVRGIGYKISR